MWGWVLRKGKVEERDPKMTREEHLSQKSQPSDPEVVGEDASIEGQRRAILAWITPIVDFISTMCQNRF